MKRRQYGPIVIIFAIAGAMWYLVPRDTEYKRIEGETQGTSYHITYEDLVKRDLQPKIDSLLHKFDLSLSSYIDESIISRINNNEELVHTDKYFNKVFNKAREVYDSTDGAFDITIGPIVRAWGFGPDMSMRADSATIDSLIMFVGMDQIELVKDQVVKQDHRIKLDVNAIAQGYAVDVVAQFLEKRGIKNYLVEIGGELKTKGVNPDTLSWKIGIDKPIDGNLVPGQNIQAIIMVDDKSLATSGNYRKFYEENGMKFVHSIDPKTGYPTRSNLLSVTILTDDCMTADAYATAFMVMGLDKSIDFLESHDFLDAYLIYADEDGDFETYSTLGFRKAIIKENN